MVPFSSILTLCTFCTNGPLGLDAGVTALKQLGIEEKELEGAGVELSASFGDRQIG